MRIFAIIFLLVSQVALGNTAPILRKLDDQSFACLRVKHGAVLDIRTQKSSELLQAIQVYSGRHDLKNPWKTLSIVKINNNRALLPYRHLSPPFRTLFVKKLWPDDSTVGKFYIHKVKYTYESLWSIASWFTGNGQNYKKIKKATGIRSDGLRKGQKLKIPTSLLYNFLKETKIDVVRPDDPISSRSTPLKEIETVQNEQAKPIVSNPLGKDTKEKEKQKKPDVTEVKEEPPPPSSAPARDLPQNGSSLPPDGIFSDVMKGRSVLSYGEDKKGRYAIYKLGKGEAIYSAVVVRFCGLIRGEDVNRVSQEIIVRSRIKDVTDMPVGRKLKIPYQNLMPEYKAPDDPEFVEWLENFKIIENVDTSFTRRGLSGVTVILDSGHGGKDPGAKKGNSWEDDYVYDILCRVKLLLEQHSGAKVIPTIKDLSAGFKPQNVKQFMLDQDEVLMTSPPFSLKKNTKLGVNMRWVLSNHELSKIIAKGGDPQQVVFISLHADSLHPSLRGSMVYIPDARSYPKKRVHAAKYFKRYKEYKNSSFKSTKKEMQKAQALSMGLAVHFLSELKKQKLPVHKQIPIRSVIFRSPRARPFVPAVLNYNRVPMRILVEVCNLNNKEDRKLIKMPAYRQKVADSLAHAIHKSFGASARIQVATKKN